LDLLITNCPERVLTVTDEGRLGTSDHCIILSEIECDVRTTKQEEQTKNWSKANYQAMRETLRVVDWQAEIRGCDTDEAWTFFKNKLKSVIDSHVPGGKCGPWKQNSWMTREIICLLRRKRTKWKVMKESGTAEAGRLYREAQKECTKKIRNAKRKMERDLANNSDKNNRKFARFIKSKTKSRNTIGPLKTEDGKLLTQSVEMAEELNRFFSSVFTKEAPDNISVPRREEMKTDMRSVKVTPAHVRDQIKNLRADSAPGPDGISPRVLKELKVEVSISLSIIFNKSLTETVVPADWKLGNVTPIYKKSPKGNPGNYCPVSLTSVPCKLLESIIKGKIMEHLLANNLIRPSQHGFMPGKSCASNLTVFMDKVTRAVDSGKSVNIFNLDFAKAFDKVPRRRLIAKLKTKGLDSKVVNWIEEWLTGRTQRVIGGEHSGESSVDSGVPQGSVL
jgi:hypothetical protein